MLSLIEEFKALVPIHNPSGGEETIRTYIAEQLKTIGLTQQTIDTVGNLFVRVPGSAEGPTIMLSAHMDSVPPCQGIEPVDDMLDGRPVVRSAGQTILGADDKSGIAMILHLCRRLTAEGFANNIPLELLFSVQEEVGLKGARGFDCKQSQAAYCYVLDGDGCVGDIFNAGPSQENLELQIVGKPAHAGLNPEAGVNAIEVAAAFIQQLSNKNLIGRLSEQTTANLGTIEGGQAINVVAPSALIRGEARSHDETALHALLKQYQDLCQQTQAAWPESQITFKPTRRYDRFWVDPAHAVVKRAQAAAMRHENLSPRICPMNIGSDAHILNAQGLATVVLGMGFQFSHSLGEVLFCDEFEQVFRIMLTLLRPDFFGSINY